MDMVTVEIVQKCRTLSLVPWAEVFGKRTECTREQWDVLAATVLRLFTRNVFTCLFGVDGASRLIRSFSQVPVPMDKGEAAWCVSGPLFDARFDSRSLRHTDFDLSDAFLAVVEQEYDLADRRIIDGFTTTATNAWRSGDPADGNTARTEMLFMHSDGVLSWTCASRPIEQIIAELDREAWLVGVQLVRVAR